MAGMTDEEMFNKLRESLTGDDLETWQLGETPKFMEIIERSRARYHQEGGVSLDEVRRRFSLVLAS